MVISTGNLVRSLVILVIGNHRGVGEHAHEFQLDGALVFRLGAFYPPLLLCSGDAKICGLCGKIFLCYFFGASANFGPFYAKFMRFTLDLGVFSSSNFSHFYTFFGLIF